MKKELYLYSGIYSYTAEDFIRQLEENKTSDITVRMHTNGGDPQAAQGMIAKIKEHRAKKSFKIKVDGKAVSTGFFMLPYADDVEALNTSSFLVHRAAYNDYYEKNGMTAEERNDLIKFNADLRKSLEVKIDPVKFALITGVTFDEIFDMSQRINVSLTADQAKAVGLVDRINDLNDSKIAADGKLLFEDDFKNVIVPKMAAEEKPKEKEIEKPLNKKIMTLAEFKAAHPEIFAEAVKEGVTAERDRVGAWMAFADVDIVAVKKGIDEGAAVGAKVMAEFTRKAMNASTLGAVGEDSPKTVETDEEKKKLQTEAEKSKAAFEAEVNKNLGRKVA